MLAAYTILRILGQGGASVVYLAHHEPLDRQVAIKVLPRDVDEPKVWERFLREARMVVLALQHHKPHRIDHHLVQTRPSDRIRRCQPGRTAVFAGLQKRVDDRTSPGMLGPH